METVSKMFLEFVNVAKVAQVMSPANDYIDELSFEIKSVCVPNHISVDPDEEEASLDLLMSCLKLVCSTLIDKNEWTRYDAFLRLTLHYMATNEDNLRSQIRDLRLTHLNHQRNQYLKLLVEKGVAA